MHELLPEVKLVYVMRHPTERLVSQYIHEWTERVTNAPIDRAVAEHPELVQYSCYAYQLRPYLDTYGSANVLPVFFDELLQEPQRELERICAFLGYPESPHWCDTLEPQNVSSMRLRKNRLRDSIVNSPLPARIRRRYVPQFLRDGLKQLWRMNDRPTISPQVRSELEQRFDEALGQLGSWMGIELCCANFKQARATRWQRSVNDM
jgi:hypothetical protein